MSNQSLYIDSEDSKDNVFLNLPSQKKKSLKSIQQIWAEKFIKKEAWFENIIWPSEFIIFTVW